MGQSEVTCLPGGGTGLGRICAVYPTSGRKVEAAQNPTFYIPDVTFRHKCMRACNVPAHSLMFTCANSRTILHWQKHDQWEGKARVYVCTSRVRCQAEGGTYKAVIEQRHVIVQSHAKVILPKSLCALSRRPCFAYLKKILEVCVYTLYMHRCPNVREGP